MAFDNTPTLEKYKTHETDTGSARVQVALLSERINYLTSISGRTRRITTAVVGSSRWLVLVAACSIT